MCTRFKLEKSIKNNDQLQKAGDNSEQVMVEHINVYNNGITREEAERLLDEKASAVMKQNISVANEIVSERLREFNNKTMSRLLEEKVLSVLADPSSVEVLVKAQREAALGNRMMDQDMLAELLAYRFKNKDDRKLGAAVYKAIENINLVDDDALLGVTILYAVTDFYPETGDLNGALTIMNELFGKLLYDSLPEGNDWVEQLLILGMVRTSKFERLKKMEDYWYDVFDGVLRVGIEKKSIKYTEAIKILKLHNMNEALLIDDRTDPDFVRLPVANKAAIGNIKMLEPGGKIREINSSEMNALREIYDLYGDKITLKEFVQEIEKYKNLATVRKWWNDIAAKQLIEVSSIGKVLANTNAQRIDKNLPGLG